MEGEIAKQQAGQIVAAAHSACNAAPPPPPPPPFPPPPGHCAPPPRVWHAALDTQPLIEQVAQGIRVFAQVSSRIWLGLPLRMAGRQPQV